MSRHFGNFFFSPILLFNCDEQFFFYKIEIIYFISHEGYIPAPEAPNLIDPPPLGMYTVVFFVCLFACFFPEEKNTNKPTEMKTLIHI